MAVGYKGDFRGIIRGNPSIIDVTTGTGPYFKRHIDYGEVKGRLQNGWDYYVGVVDLRQEDSMLYPLLLPKCSDNNLGYFMLIFDVVDPNAHNLWGELSDTQYLLKFNPENGGDISDVVEDVITLNYITSMPMRGISLIERDFYDYNYIDGELDPIMKTRLDDYINDYLNKIAYDYRKTTGVMISGITQLDELYFTKDDYELETKLLWSHPHKYIRDTLGKPGDWLDYNIAGNTLDFL